MRKSFLITVGVLIGLVSLVQPLALIVLPLLFLGTRILVNPQRVPILAVKVEQVAQPVGARA